VDVVIGTGLNGPIGAAGAGVIDTGTNFVMGTAGMIIGSLKRPSRNGRICFKRFRDIFGDIGRKNRK